MVNKLILDARNTHTKIFSKTLQSDNRWCSELVVHSLVQRRRISVVELMYLLNQLKTDDKYSKSVLQWLKRSEKIEHSCSHFSFSLFAHFTI